MAKTIANVETTQTFSAWLDKTNELAGAFANVVSVDAGAYPVGTAGVNGTFIANTLTVTTGILTANASANIVGSANVTVAVNVGANVTANTSALKVGNSTVNSIITSTTASVGSNVVANTSALLIGNSSVNTVITSSSIDTDGSLSVLGATLVSNTLAAGNTTITGFANVSSTLAAGNTTITGFANVSSTLAAGNTTITGFANVTSTLAAGNTTITGFANVSGTANVGGATNLRSTLTVNGAVTIANTLSSGNTSTANLDITGFANVSSTANVGGATNLRSTLTVNGAVTIANSVASGNNDLTGYVNVSSTANVGGATTLRSTLTVNGAVTIANTLSSGNTSTANLSVTGFANISGSANVGGAVNLRDTLTVNGAVIIANTVSSGNTSTANLSVTGFANVSGTANVGGAVNLRSTLAVNGAVTISNTLSSGNTTVANLTVSGVINRNPTITLNGDLTGSVTLTDLQNGTLTATIAADSIALGTDTTGDYVASFAVANGISGSASGEGSTPTLRLVPNNGISANSSGAFARAANGISVDSSGINVLAGVGLFANATGVHVNTATIATVGSPTFTGDAGFANITITGIINANGSLGSAGQVLRTDATGKVYWANPLLAGDTGFIEDVSNGVGLSKGGTSKIPSLAVIANNGIVANSTGTFVNANNGIVANTTGTFVRANTGLVANSDGLFVNASYIATISANNAAYLGGELPAYYTNATNISAGTLAVGRGGTGVTTANGTGSVIRQSDAVFLANTTIARMVANGALGTAGQHLAANSTGGLYWETPQVGDITAVTAGNGITGGGSSGDVTVTVNAQTGLLANSSGLYVNASSVAVGVLPVGVGGTGATTFTSGGLLRGNGTSAVSVASAADIVAAIGTTRVANATYADNSGLATNATRATASNNSLVADDTTSAGTYYPVWVDATSGDKPIKLSSTKLTFNPATGVLSATSFSGSGASLTGLDAGNIGAGTLPVARGGTGVTSSTGTTSVVLSASPTLTGTPAAPTAAVDTNTTQIATTAYVIAQGYLKTGTAASTYLPLAGGTVTGNLIVSGNLTIDGTTTNINTTNLVVEDKNIILGDVTTPSNTTADGGGITLNGATNKTLNWVNSTGAWTSSEDFNLLTGKVYEINGTTVLSSSALGSGVTGSSLTSVGTIGTGIWQGTAVAVAYGGTGATSAPAARTNLGATTLGSNIFTITNPGAITFPRFNADNTISSLSDSAFRTAIGATTIGGNIFTLTNPGAVTFPRFNADNTISSLTAADFRTAIGAGTSSTTGTVTSVATGSGLTGGTITSTGTLSVDSTVIRTTGDQSMAGTKTFSGALAVTGTMSINNAGGSEGGEFRMQKPVTGSTISGDLVIDLVGNALRIFEASGTNRGVSVDITGGGASVGSALLHSTNYNTYAPTLTGGGASGNWGINITGSSASTTGNAGTVTNGVYTTGDQTIGGTKNFSNTVLLANSGFMFSSDGSQDTGINWASDGVMNVRSNGVTIGQFNGSGFTGNAGTVTNGVYTTGDQTIGGTKTFSSTISGSINGNAGTATKASTVNNTKNSGAISMWTGTLAEYNAIGTKDSTTLYFVT